MIRAFSSTCLAFLLVCLAGNAYAGKPLIAVLGLEVVDSSGTPTPQDTQVAKALTEGLRSRAKAGSGPYQIAGNSDKELIDEKLLKNCDSESPVCMAQIGNDLGADVLMYGKIEKKGTAYTVTMKLLEVHRKIVEKSWNEPIPLSQTNEAELQRWAKNIYAKLTGQSTAGQILVKLQNGDHGTILLNGDEKGSITNGVGQVASVEEGKYKLEVQSEGFRPWSDSITVRPGETTNVGVKLEKADGGNRIIEPPPGGGPPGGGGIVVEGGSRGSATWKGVFIGSVVVGLAGGGIVLYGRNQISDARSALCAGGAYNPDMPDANHPVVDPSCAKPSSLSNPLTPSQVDSYNSKGDSGRTLTWVGGVTAGVAGAFAIVALYKGFIAKDSGGSSGEHAVNGKRVRRDRFVVTPIVAPDGGGATLRFDW
jgi:hypothetical protein